MRETFFGIASASASAKTCATGPVVSTSSGSPAAPGVTVTCAPHGTASSRCLVSAAIASPASWPGAIRIEILAVAVGTIWLMASLTGGASIASTEMEGCIHIRAVRPPEPMSSTPSTAPDQVVTRLAESVTGSGVGSS